MKKKKAITRDRLMECVRISAADVELLSWLTHHAERRTLKDWKEFLKEKNIRFVQFG